MYFFLFNIFIVLLFFFGLFGLCVGNFVMLIFVLVEFFFGLFLVMDFIDEMSFWFKILGFLFLFFVIVFFLNCSFFIDFFLLFLMSLFWINCLLWFDLYFSIFDILVFMVLSFFLLWSVIFEILCGNNFFMLVNFFDFCLNLS